MPVRACVCAPARACPWLPGCLLSLSLLHTVVCASTCRPALSSGREARTGVPAAGGGRWGPRRLAPGCARLATLRRGRDGGGPRARPGGRLRSARGKTLSIPSLDGSRILKLAQPSAALPVCFSRTDCQGIRRLNSPAPPRSAGQAEEHAGQTQLAEPRGSDAAAPATASRTDVPVC